MESSEKINGYINPLLIPGVKEAGYSIEDFKGLIAEYENQNFLSIS